MLWPSQFHWMELKLLNFNGNVVYRTFGANKVLANVLKFRYIMGNKVLLEKSKQCFSGLDHHYFSPIFSTDIQEYLQIERCWKWKKAYCSLFSRSWVWLGREMLVVTASWWTRLQNACTACLSLLPVRKGTTFWIRWDVLLYSYSLESSLLFCTYWSTPEKKNWLFPMGPSD